MPNKNAQSNARTAWNELIGKFGDTAVKKTEPGLGAGDAPAAEQTRTEPVAVMPPAEPAKRKTILSESVEISGSVNADADIEIYGTVNGDVTSTGTVLICGKVNGNIKATKAVFANATVTGSVSVSGSVDMDKGSVVSGGKITADSICTNGSVQCDMEATGIVKLLADARINGSIKSGRISIDEGAFFTGTVSIG